MPIDYSELGLIRIAAVSPAIQIADPHANAEAIANAYRRFADRSCSVILTPEMSLTGYTCEDLFLKEDLLARTQEALLQLAGSTGESHLIVGAPCVLVDSRVLNCAYVLAEGNILGAVPKLAIPNHGEFYERRWFSSGQGVASYVRSGDKVFRVDTQQLFQVSSAYYGIEICEDLWSPQPLSSQHAVQGAQILLNPSASPELVSKADYRRELVRIQSARCLAGYVYAGAGATESTKDLVYGGHLLAAENGVILGQSDRYSLEENALVVDFDVQKLAHERRSNSTFATVQRSNTYIVQGTSSTISLQNHLRILDRHPFVPDDVEESDARAEEIMHIQTTGLARRVRQVGCQSLVIGLSGGLDSTLAFLVCLEVLKKLAPSAPKIAAITLPGPGTSDHTLETVRRLCEITEIELKEIPIQEAVEHHLEDLGHSKDPDLVFENSQARERTQILFDYANKVDGIVIGTGDLSELALGWCTYNADHMSSYNVNVGVPKTLIKYVVQWYATHRADSALRETLIRVLETPISPELIPHEEGKMTQFTEEQVGPFELHDFFLYHFLRTGASARKIYIWACEAFQDKYTHSDVKFWLRVFFNRFFAQQFKRTTLPAGPKVGTVSLSPRGDWRMPDEVDAFTFLKSIDDF